jgi:hypothetical protein
MGRFAEPESIVAPVDYGRDLATATLRSRTIPASMERERLESALDGLRGFGDADAIRASEHLECAVDHSKQRGKRWTEQMCYCLRECLEGIPPLFGQKKVAQPRDMAARRFSKDISEAIAVDHPPDVLRRLVSGFDQELEVAERRRRYRIAQAMMTQAGAGMSSPHVDAFAAEWTSTVEGVNRILHGSEHSEDEALNLFERTIDLLAALVGPISSRLEEADRYLALEAPRELEVRRMLELLADERLARYFFSKVDSPAWLKALDANGVFAVPMQGDWYQAGLLIRVSRRAPKLTMDIATRIADDRHRAAPIVVLGIARELGPAATALAVRVLSAGSFLDPFGTAHELELTIEEWAGRGETETFHELADVALGPQRRESGWRVRGKFDDDQYARLVRLFVARVACEHLVSLTEKLVFKLRRAATLLEGSLGLSFRRDLIDVDDRSERDVGNALVSGVRDALHRLRGCGADLGTRRRLLGDLDSEILVRLWAGHLAEEEQHAP